MPIKIISISLPEYRLDSPPDSEKIGRALDECIKKEFVDRKIAIRCLGLADHPSMSMDELVKTIQKLGTDKYDPERKMVCHDFYAKQGVASKESIFAVEYDFPNGANTMKETIDDFYEGALADRGFRVRIDLITIYDINQLQTVPIDYGNGEVGRDCFIFRSPEQKQNALIGIIKVF